MATTPAITPTTIPTTVPVLGPDDPDDDPISAELCVVSVFDPEVSGDVLGVTKTVRTVPSAVTVWAAEGVGVRVCVRLATRFLSSRFRFHV